MKNVQKPREAANKPRPAFEGVQNREKNNQARAAFDGVQKPREAADEPRPAFEGIQKSRATDKPRPAFEGVQKYFKPTILSQNNPYYCPQLPLAPFFFIRKP